MNRTPDKEKDRMLKKQEFVCECGVRFKAKDENGMIQQLLQLALEKTHEKEKAECQIEKASVLPKSKWKNKVRFIQHVYGAIVERCLHN